MYTLNDVQSSLLPELLHPDDAVLSVKSSAKVRNPVTLFTLGFSITVGVGSC